MRGTNGWSATEGFELVFGLLVKVMLVKNTGYPKKNTIGKRKNRPIHLWSLGVFFLTHSLMFSGCFLCFLVRGSFHRVFFGLAMFADVWPFMSLT